MHVESPDELPEEQKSEIRAKRLDSGGLCRGLGTRIYQMLQRSSSEELALKTMGSSRHLERKACQF